MITVAGAAQSAGATTAWFTLAGALGGVLITSAVGLTSVILNQRWQAANTGQQFLHEHNRQLRQERRETFAHYWSAWNQLNYQVRALREAAKELQVMDDPPTNPREYLEGKQPQLVRDAWTAEMNWREAADAVFLIGNQSVLDAAAIHVEVTDQKITAAWQGEYRHDVDGEVAHRLNAAMRDDLLLPPRHCSAAA
jgi:hypothetical protein